MRIDDQKLLSELLKLFPLAKKNRVKGQKSFTDVIWFLLRHYKKSKEKNNVKRPND